VTVIAITRIAREMSCPRSTPPTLPTRPRAEKAIPSRASGATTLAVGRGARYRPFRAIAAQCATRRSAVVRCAAYSAAV